MVMGRLIVSNMGNEMFNDGLFYTEQAEIQDNQFNRWRYCRAAIISFCAAAEAEISKLIVKSLKKQSKLYSDDRKVLRFLTEPNIKSKNIPTVLASNRRRYNYLRKINDLDRKSLNMKYDDLTKLRNMIIHYSYSSHDTVYSDTLLETSKAASEIVRDYIKELYEITNETLPQWINNTSSRTIG